MRYLKIKDEVDLKELEKFGFEYMQGYKNLTAYVMYDDEEELIIPDKQALQEFKSRYIYVLSCESKTICVLFDLIQAGLVEVVEE